MLKKIPRRHTLRIQAIIDGFLEGWEVFEFENTFGETQTVSDLLDDFDEERFYKLLGEKFSNLYYDAERAIYILFLKSGRIEFRSTFIP